MLRNIIIAIVIGVVITLVCMFVGALLVTMEIAWVVAAGSFLVKFAALLGLLTALYVGARGHLR